MKVAVKTLTGAKFDIQAEPSTTIGECKNLINKAKDFPTEGMKLICDGKVLKDDVTLEGAGVKEGSFLVCFVSKKAKKKQAAAAAPAPAPTQPTPMDTTPEGSVGTTSTASSTPANTATSAPSTGQQATTAPSSVAPAQTQATTTDASPNSNTATTPAVVPAPAAPAANAVDAAKLAQVIEISGTDEATATAALQAAFGDVNRAIQYVFDPSSMPVQQPVAAPAATPQTGTTPTAGGAGGALEQLRNDPRFDQLRTMVQQNPSSLPAVLRGIEQSNPELFAIINQNTEAFVQMLNEPVQNRAPAQQQQAAAPQQQGIPGLGGLGGGRGGMPNPQQLLQMINSMPPEARAQMAQQIGMTPEQLQQVSQMMASVPPEQMQQMMGQMGAMGGGGPPGGAAGGAGPPPGTIQVNLTPEDQAAVARLEAMGLGSRGEIVQVYLACDRNENQAANILMDQAFQ